jgi:hypothetical protein
MPRNLSFFFILGASSQLPSIGFGKQMFLTDDELLGLTLATIDQMNSYVFLTIECRKGRICYASSSVETVLGYKPVCLSTVSFIYILSVLRDQRLKSAHIHSLASSIRMIVIL